MPNTLKGLFLTLLCSLSVSLAFAEHPFIIVKASEYPALREQAAQEPWAHMKADAIQNVSREPFVLTASMQKRSTQLSDLMSANALAYILDPANRDTYRERIIQYFAYWDKSVPGNIRTEMKRHPWPNNVPAAGAFLNSILALDIIHDDLSPSQLGRIERLLKDVSNFFAQNKSSWLISDYSVRGVWALYTGDPSALEQARKDYRQEIESYLSADGIFLEGPGYAFARLTNSDREQKHFFMDILEYHHLDHWYDDPQMKALYTWLTGNAVSPSKRAWPFGDTPPVTLRTHLKPGLLRAARFSEKAGAYSRWLQPDEEVPGRLLTYLTAGRERPAAKVSGSRIYPDGGAFFREPIDSEAALAAVLWNLKKDRPHSHFDVNAIALAAYGQMLMANSGYNGWGNAYQGFTWEYINSRAVSSSTVLFDYEVGDEKNPSTTNNHALKYGGGLLAGFTTPGFDLALGTSADAIPNGRHDRTLAMIHPQDGIDGYFVTWDDVAAVSKDATANLVFHPYSEDLTEVEKCVEYRSRMDGKNTPALTISFARPAASVEVHQGVVAAFANPFGGFTKYIKANFPTKATGGKATLLSVLYPEDTTHLKPEIKRLAHPGYSGLRIVHSPLVQDYVVEAAASPEPVTIGGVTLQTSGALYRLNDGSLDWYYTHGRSFTDNRQPATGFTSTAPVLVYLKGGEGRVSLLAEATVTFHQPGATGMTVDGEPISGGSAETGWRVTLPAGNHTLSFATHTSP